MPQIVTRPNGEQVKLSPNYESVNLCRKCRKRHLDIRAVQGGEVYCPDCTYQTYHQLYVQSKQN